MKRTCRASTARTLLRLGALLVTPLVCLWSCGTPPLAPFAGAPEALEMDFIPLPVGQLNVAGGNFLLGRTDLTIDTRLGTQAFGATWNSATGTWRWSTDLDYDGTQFVDASGAVHAVSGIQPGHAIPGTHWRVVDASRLETKGGLIHRFGSDGLLEEVHWSGDAFPTLRFLYTTSGGSRKLVTVEQCVANTSCSLVFAMAYDAAGRLASVADRAGRVAQYTYDPAGELTSAQDPVATANNLPGIRYAYANGQISAVTNGDDEHIALTYGGKRLLSLTQVGDENPAWAFSYLAPDASHRYRTIVTDPLGNASHYAYDGSGQLLEADRPSGDAWTWTWSGGRIATVTDPRGSTASLFYADDDPVEVTLPSGNVIDFSYRSDAENRLAPHRTALDAVSDSVGTILQATYDGAGHLTTLSNGAGETRSFTYDSLGEIATSTSPSGYTLTYSGYGDHGHPTTVTSPYVTATRIYDAVGNLLQGSAQEPDFGTLAGGVVSRSFDGDRRIRQEVLADQPTDGTPVTDQLLRIDRRADGRPLAIHRPYGGDTEFIYDEIGRLVARRTFAGGAWRTTTLTVDAMGRPGSVVRPNGMEIDRTWNPDGRLASLSRSRNGNLKGFATYNYTGGLLASIQDSIDGGIETYERDASGQPTVIHYPSGETLEFQYDLRERDTQETYLGADDPTPLRTLAFAYDGANRLVSVLDDGTPVVTRTYGQGRISQIAYGNGLTRSFGYDARSALLETVQTQDRRGNLLESTQIAWIASSTNLLVYFQQTLPVLTSAEQYSLVPADTATNSGGSRMLSDNDDSTFGYDALSNVTHRGIRPHDLQLSYDSEHSRLLSIDDASGNPVHTYAYDAAGFVTKRDGVGISWTADGRLANLGSSLAVKWDLEGRIEAMDVLGQTTRFLFGGRVSADNDGNPRKILLKEVEIDLATGQRLYRHFDFRGNVAFVTDSTGSIVQAFDYSAFGLHSSYGLVPGQRAFASSRSLGGDLFWIGSRLYDAAAARFLAPDPVFQLVNQFSYATANPIQFWDPEGGTSKPVVATGVTLVGLFAAAFVAPEALPAFVLAIYGFDIGLLGSHQAVARIYTGVVFFLFAGGPAGVGGFLAGIAAGQLLAPTLGGKPPRLDPPNPDYDQVPDNMIPNFNLALASAETAIGASASGSGGGGGGAGSGGGGGGGGAGLCDVALLGGSGPSLTWLWLLGPLQVGFGAWLLRARRRGRRKQVCP